MRAKDLVDQAIGWLRQIRSIDAEKPYMLYMATGATHAPHHVRPEFIAKFQGQFDSGWDVYREETLARQKQLGVVPPDTKLTPRPKELPAWKTLSPDQKRLFTRMMEVFAGFTAETDHEMGRLLEVVQSLPDAGNTLIFYLVGDNGASAEGGLVGLLKSIHHEGHFSRSASGGSSDVACRVCLRRQWFGQGGSPCRFS